MVSGLTGPAFPLVTPLTVTHAALVFVWGSPVHHFGGVLSHFHKMYHSYFYLRAFHDMHVYCRVPAEIAEYFGSIGIVKIDKKTKKHKIWLYRDKGTGALKGDGTVRWGRFCQGRLRTLRPLMLAATTHRV